VRKFGAATLPCNEKLGVGYSIKFITAHFDFYYLSTQLNKQPNTIRFLLFFALLLAQQSFAQRFHLYEDSKS
jgi:hypothetical protein